MFTLEQILSKLQEIKKLGYVRTHRKGDTGIGKTLEDLLGIEENNFPSSNGHLIELKSGRKSATSMGTLFTKSPLPRKANTAMLRGYGYPSEDGNSKRFEVTVHSNEFYTVKGVPTFKIRVKPETIEVVNTEYDVVGYWTREILKRHFERKLPERLLVKADSKKDRDKKLFGIMRLGY